MQCEKCGKEHREGFTCEQDPRVMRMISSAARAAELFDQEELEEFARQDRLERKAGVK